MMRSTFARGLCAALFTSTIVSLCHAQSAAEFYKGWFAALVTIAGPVYASLSFRELHDKARNEAYLLLPASSLEKTIARLLRSTVGFIVYLLLLTMLSSAVNEGIKWLVFGRTNPLFNPLELETWQVIGLFVVIQSMFFLGAAWFRRMHFLKTWLTLIAIPTVLGCVAIAIAWLLYGHANFTFEDGDLMNFYLAHQNTFDALKVLGRLLFFVALPLFCWSVAWLRVKETQVSHGV